MTAPDLPGFVLARIAENEADARASAEVNPPPWHVHLSQMGGDTGLVMGGETPANRHLGGALWDNEGADSLSMEPATAAHIARHDPARVLAECAALRAVVEQYVRLNTRPYMPEGHGCGLHPGDCFDEDGGNISEAGFADYLYGPCAVWERVKRENPAAPPEATLRLLAQPYAHRPDFDPAWRV